MARTFDIRFARSDGIAAILESPANTFRLRGTGSLSIDDTGLEIEPKRGLHSFLSRRVRVRISAAHLREVSREGDSVRIEYGLPGSKRIVLPFWVRDRETAVEILKLVPTQRTIEHDDPAATPAITAIPRRGHSTAIVIVAAFISLLVGVVVTALIENRRAASITPVSTPTDIASTQAAVPAKSVIVPKKFTVESNEAAEATHAAAASQLEQFLAEVRALQVDYAEDRALPADLERRWWSLTERLYNSPAFDDPRLRPAVDAQLSLSLNWRVSLSNYSEAVNSGDQNRIDAARADLVRAGELTDRVRGSNF